MNMSRQEYTDTATRPISSLRFELDEHCSLHEKIGLLTLLIDQHLDRALIISDGNGGILWANDYALSVAVKWGVFAIIDSELVIHDDRLQRLLSVSPCTTPCNPGCKYFSSGDLYFEVSLFYYRDERSEAHMIAVTIDCHEFKSCEQHSLQELSPAEYRLIKSLEINHSLKPAAASLNISYENARTKLKRIFEKLDVHSQQELLTKVRHVFDHKEFLQ